MLTNNSAPTVMISPNSAVSSLARIASIVALILLTGSYPKIAATIVETIMVNVINWRVGESKKLSMHVDAPFPLRSLSATTSIEDSMCLKRMPFHRRQRFVINVINERDFSL
jgi:hypothetical protein